MSRHISEQYDLELGAIRDQFMEMGGLVEQQVADAGLAFITHNLPLADKVNENEARVNQMELAIDNNCVAIIARRQPAASDLRRVIGVMKANADLERSGDEANRVAKLAHSIADQDLPADQYGELRKIHADVCTMLNRSLDAFARLDVDAAREVIASDAEVDDAYRTMVRRCTGMLKENRDDAAHLLNQMWVARAFERIGDHAKNMSEYVIYQVLGRDVRHQPG